MQSKLAMITFMDGDGGGGSIDNTLPWAPVYPSGGPVPPGGALLPVYPFDPTVPDNSLPPSPGHPSGGPIVPGRKFIVKYLACAGLILVPDNTLPETPAPK